MNEIIKSQIRFLEIKLASATGDRKAELEAKINALKQNPERNITEVYKDGAKPKSKRNKRGKVIAAPAPAPALSEEEIEARQKKREKRKAERLAKKQVVEPEVVVEPIASIGVEEELTELLEEEIKKAEEELPTVEEVEKEIEELPEIKEEELDEKPPAAVIIEIPEKEEKGDDGVDVIGEDVPNEPPAPVDPAPPVDPVVVPVVVAPVVTEATTKKPVKKRGRPKGSANKRKTTKK